MKSFCYLAATVALGAAGTALATPDIDSARINGRLFNDYPASNFTSVNNYPALVNLSDGNMLGPPAFANRHNWRLSDDGGATNASFANGDHFTLFADVNISVTGTGAGEGGLQLSPWWSPNIDGAFNIRTTDGEVAVFGGRLPFYSFTAQHGVNYVAGTTARVGIEYHPQGLSMAAPALIRYSYDSATTGFLNSGWLAFDQGNPAEDPPYGLWGMLNDAAVGGYLQIFGQQTGSGSVSADFRNITFTPAPGALGLLALGGLAAGRRRRA